VCWPAHGDTVQRWMHGTNDVDRFVERAAFAHGQLFEQYRRRAAPLRLGGRMPAPAQADPFARQQALHDHGEKRAEGSPPFVAAKDGVVVLDQREFRGGSEILRVRIAKSRAATDAGDDALHEWKVRAEQLFGMHSMDERGISEKFP